MSKPYEHYTEEFKKKVVQLVESGKRRSDVARAYGISAPNIRIWQQKYGTLPVSTRKNTKKEETKPVSE